MVNKIKSYLIDLLSKLIEIESPTCHEKDIANLIYKSMNDIGFNHVYMDNNFNVVGELKASTPGKSLLLLNHSDTSTLTSEQRPPKAELIADYLFGKKKILVIKGPGAASPKASIAAMLGAAKRLSEQRNDWKGCVKVAIVTQDLIANHDGPRQISSLIKDVDLAITAEPSNNNLVIAARGLLHIKVTIYGQSTHRAIPEIRNNAIYKLGVFLEKLKKIPILEDEQFGLTGFNPIQIEIHDFSPFLPKSINLIIDRRILPEESVDKVYNQIKSLGNEVGDNQQEVEIIRKMYPFQIKNAEQEKELLKSIINDITRRNLKEISIGFGSNAAFLTHELKIPSLIMGPGSLDHSGKNEFIEVKSFVDASNIYYNFALKYLC